MPITTTTIGSGTVETSASGAVTDVTDLQTLIGRPDGSTHLGTFANRDLTNAAAYPTLPNNATVKATFQDSLEQLEQIGGFNVINYGADPTGATDATDAIQRACDAAYAATNYLAVGTYGTSINRRYAPPVFFPEGVYLLNKAASGIVLNAVGQHVNWVGDRAVIRCGGSFTATNFGLACSTHDQVMTSTMFFHMSGISWLDFRRAIRVGTANNNINLGEISFEDCHFIGRAAGDSLGVQVFNRSETCNFVRCQWDNCLKAAEIQSCDRAYLTDCRVQLTAYVPASQRETLHGVFTLRRGQLHATRCTLNPQTTSAWTASRSYVVGDLWRADVTNDSPDLGLQLFRCKTAHTAAGDQVFDTTYRDAYWEVVENRNNPLAWFKAEDYPPWGPQGTTYVAGDVVNGNIGAGADLLVCTQTHVASASQTTDAASWTPVDDTDAGCLSVWCHVNIRDTLFGGEGGGHTPVIWNIAAHAASPSYPRGVRIQDCEINCDARYGKENLEYASSTFRRSSPVVLLAQTPNYCFVDDNEYGSTYMLAVDYWAEASPMPTAFTPTQVKPLEVRARNNVGGLFYNHSPSGGQLYKYSPNWIPLDLAIMPLGQTVANNDFGPHLPNGNAVFSLGASDASSMGLFYGASNGQMFTLLVDGSSTTLDHNTYMQLAGGVDWTPGPGGGAITFVVRDGIAHEINRCRKGAPMTAGTGITGGVGTVYRASIEHGSGLIVTRIFLDLTGLNSGGTAGDVIGKNATANCHLGQINTKLTGTLRAGRMWILETPIGGQTDIDLYAAAESSLTEDLSVTIGDETLLCDAGDWLAGEVKTLTALPDDTEYLYLVGAGTTSATYTAGQVMIELIGTL